MKTKAGTDWQPTDEQLLGWQHAYPEVDVFAELNVMAVWLDSNEPKRKTERGMPRFVNSWLSRANQKGGSPFAQEAEKESGPSSTIAVTILCKAKAIGSYALIGLGSM